MSNGKKKYNDFAIGWVKTTNDGRQYISCLAAAGSKKNPVKIDMFVSINGQEPRKVESFAGFFTPSEDKDGRPRPENAPQVKFTFTTEE